MANQNFEAKQKNFKGDRAALNLLQNAIAINDFTSWNKWRAKNLKKDLILNGVDLSGKNLEGALLNYAYLADSNFERSILKDTNFYSSICTNTNFNDANMEVVNLANADLKNSSFVKSYLGGADIQDADLRNSDFTYASLNSADFSGSKLTGIRIKGINTPGTSFHNTSCDFIYTDFSGNNRAPKKRNFNPNEFENLVYKNEGINKNFYTDLEKNFFIRHVFISYVNEDSNYVKNLSEELEIRGIKVWLDKQDLDPGVKWENSIIKAIKNGLCFIACFSTNSEKKPKTFQRKEIRIALNELSLMPEEKIWLIPVKLSECEIQPMKSTDGTEIRSLQWIDMYSNMEKGIDKLINVIENRILAY